MKKIIINTDPGVDDALAIFFAIYARLDILALITTFGNSTVSQTTRNASTLLNFLKVNIPIYKGAAKPLIGRPVLAQSHGKNALGEFTLNQKPIYKNAIKYLTNELLKNEKITIVCIGPLTNIAKALRIKPQIVKNIEEIVILGGIFGERGNITTYAEFNTYNDPLALKEVLALKCKKIIIPANICRKVYFEQVDFQKINNERIKKLLKRITKRYIDYYKYNEEFGGFPGGVMYDLLAIAYLLDLSLFSIQDKRVSVRINGVKKGLTSYRKGGSNTKVVTNTDEKRLKELFFKIMNLSY